jgi:hypothetical protein
MDAQHRRTMREMAREMAATNGYVAQQAGRWYPTSGTLGDWIYETHDVLPLTMELGPRTGAADRYLGSKQMRAEVQGNRQALLWWLEQAGCPSAVIDVPCESAGSSGAGSLGAGAAPRLD